MCLQEEGEILQEKEFLKRVAQFPSPVYCETWLPQYSRHNLANVVATLVDRHTRDMKVRVMCGDTFFISHNTIVCDINRRLRVIYVHHFGFFPFECTCIKHPIN